MRERGRELRETVEREIVGREGKRERVERKSWAIERERRDRDIVQG